MPWIDTIAYEDADARLRKLYDRVKGPNNNVDNIMMMHSLRPHTMEGHMKLYKNVLHHSANMVPKWFLETIGVWVSLLNRCDYCADHHFAGLARLLDDEDRSTAIGATLGQGVIDACPVEDKEKGALRYAETLTRNPSSVTEAMVQGLRNGGYGDGEILEINQVTAYFNYANRTVLGLGCTSDGDDLGLSPGQNDDPDNWSHE